MTRQLFHLTDEVLDAYASDLDAVVEDCVLMADHDRLFLPFPQVTIRLSWQQWERMVMFAQPKASPNPAYQSVTYVDLDVDAGPDNRFNLVAVKSRAGEQTVNVLLDTKRGLGPYKSMAIYENTRDAAVIPTLALISLLNTRFIKQTQHRPLPAKKASRGFNKAVTLPRLVTTLSIDREALNRAYPASEGYAVTGRTVRPHLRRAHERDQHHGPNNSLLKRVFIHATLVNGFDGEHDREGYHVKI